MASAKSKRVKNPTTVGDLLGGDVAVIGETTYRLMISLRDAWGCREKLEDGSWSAHHTWFKMDVPIKRVVKLQNQEKSKGSGENEDPLMRR